MTYYQAEESNPDPQIHVGEIENGTRLVWLKAASAEDCRKFLRTLFVFPQTVRPLELGHHPNHAEGLDYDLTVPHNDRPVTTNDATHKCHAFTSEMKGGELILKCKTCGAILHDNPRPLGGYYSN